jgi:hypothetical protein
MSTSDETGDPGTVDPNRIDPQQPHPAHRSVTHMVAGAGETLEMLRAVKRDAEMLRACQLEAAGIEDAVAFGRDDARRRSRQARTGGDVDCARAGCLGAGIH